MQRLVDQTGDHLENTRQQVHLIEQNHAREVSELKSHFNRFRRAQAEVVRSLEDQLEDLRNESSQQQVLNQQQQPNNRSNVRNTQPFSAAVNNTLRQGVDDSLNGGGPSVASQLNSLPEAEDVIRKMEFKYKIKAAELEAVMR